MSMRSIWTDKVDTTCPLPEYPRPQLVREGWMNLNGTYEYAIAPRAKTWVDTFDGEILVPFAVESLLSGVEKPLLPSDRLWYRRKFSIPENLLGRNILLHFGAVDWQCDVYINHTLVGSHTGGYCAFSFDITKYLTDGENELTVSVYDPTDEGWQQRGKQVIHTTGFWYTATSGIWQTVWLEAVSDVYVKKLRFLPDIDKGTVSLKTELNAQTDAELCVSVSFAGKPFMRVRFPPTRRSQSKIHSCGVPKRQICMTCV